MINSLKSYDSNPQIGYKVDPGERGLSLSSPASTSIMRVASHEARNIAQFKNNAASQNGVVIYSDIDIIFEKRGAFLAAVGGKSKAVILYKKDSEDIQNIDGYMVSDEMKKESNFQEDKEDKKDNRLNIGNDDTELKIKDIENKILIEKDPEKIEKLENEKIIYELMKNFKNSGLSSEFGIGLNINTLL
ncbi:hypothetical protein [Oceanotoga teriensis]|jgi:hypothetical protein|uniref:hypothetical protein n=1 Tax=Oceanotoga teriensis TaxID=515440 RepID=UPI00271385FA|nr:hypothetical protein [Oceanotoga teriensis]MDO7977804.1 hypothetical protein [Oceanotoga teriensis]